MAKQVEGIIYVAAHERFLYCIPEDLPIPAVMAYGYTESKKVPSVVVDDEDGAYQIIQYLIEEGHTKIGVITGKKNSPHMQERLLGYQRALYEHHILYNPDLVCIGDWTRDTGYENTDSLIKQGVTAIFCMNDLMAGGVYDRLEELGMKVGEDISMVGYDNRELSAYYKPSLSTISLPLHDIGYMASEVILKMLHKEELICPDRIYRVKCHKLIRKSVKRLEK